MNLLRVVVFFRSASPPPRHHVVTIDNRQSLINDDTSALLRCFCLLLLSPIDMGLPHFPILKYCWRHHRLVYCAIFPLIKCQTELKYTNTRSRPMIEKGNGGEVVRRDCAIRRAGSPTDRRSIKTGWPTMDDHNEFDSRWTCGSRSGDWQFVVIVICV